MSVKEVFLIGGLSVFCCAAPTYAATIVDGNFIDWSFDATGTAFVTRESIGGNPDARLNVTTISGPTVWGTAIKNDFITESTLEGANFTLELDVLSGPGSFGQGQGILLLVEQNSNIYGTTLGITGFPRNFNTPVSFNGTFSANSFGLLLGSGINNPDFSGGVNTKFGFAAGNTISGTLTQFYDNFRLDIPSVSAETVPEPQTILGLVSTLILGITLNKKQERGSTKQS